MSLGKSLAKYAQPEGRPWYGKQGHVACRANDGWRVGSKLRMALGAIITTVYLSIQHRYAKDVLSMVGR